MRRTTIGSRWSTPGRRYAGGWRHNPWINAMCSALHAPSETGASSNARIDADSAASCGLAGQPVSDTSQHKDSNQDTQQRAAERTWENEGGSPGLHLA